MPQIRLSTHVLGRPLPVEPNVGSGILIPRLQFRCWVRLPNTFMPRDGIIDTGSPLTWFPEDVWSPFQHGRDFEWLPFAPGYTPPRGQTGGWAFSFRMARLLQPMSLFDTQTELIREGTIVQFTDGNPLAPMNSKRPPLVVIGLWGGILEGTNLRMTTNATTGQTLGSLEW